MKEYLTPLIQIQRFFLPGLLALLCWAIWRVVWKKDLAVGLVLYLGLVIIVDGFMNTGIYILGLDRGSIRYSEICAAVLFAKRPPASSERSPNRLIYFLLGLYFILLLVSALRIHPVLDGIYEFRRLIVPQIVGFLVAMRALNSSGEYRRFFLCLTALVIFVGLFNFWDIFFDRWILHGDMLFKPEYFYNRGIKRFGSVFLNPNMLGAFAVLTFPLLFVRALNERKNWIRLYAWAGLSSLVFCLVETQSRGPLLAFGITLLVMVFGPSGGIPRKRLIGFLVLFFMIFVFFMPGFFQHAVERFNLLDKEITTEELSRKGIWLSTLSIIRDYPLGGIGFGEQQFLNVLESYGVREKYGRMLDNPHNSYLQIAVYAGIPTLAVFLLVNSLLIFKSMKMCATRKTGEIVDPSFFGLTVGIVGFLAAIYPDMALFTQNVAPVYWVFFGLLMSLLAKTSNAKLELMGT